MAPSRPRPLPRHPEPRHQELRGRRHRRRGWSGLLLVGALIIAGCGSTVSGIAVLPTAAVPGGSTGASTAATGGGITVPSVPPSAGRTTDGGSSSGTNSPGPQSADGSATSSPGSGSGAPGTVPAGLEKFYSQQLQWGGCASYATSADDRVTYPAAVLQCARLTVPVAYDEPAGQTITIGVLRKKATAGPRIGSLLFNPGGPGASGMSLVSQIALAGGRPDIPMHSVISALNEKFDLVGFDPRGIGSSLPVVTCQTDAERDAFRATDARSKTQADVDAANATSKRIVAQCEQRTGKEQGIDGGMFLANDGTRDVARDLDVLRAALGDPKLTYVGFSYGTRIGYVYAEQFPANVRAMILDGAVAPDQDPGTELINQAKGFQKAFETFATWCTKQANCIFGKDPAKATAVYQSLVRPLLATPAKLSDGRVLSFTDANTGTIQAMYSESLWPALSAALLKLSTGSGQALMALADSYNERDSSGHYTSLQDAFNAVRCMDNPRLTDPSQIAKLNAKYAAASPFQDSGDPPGALADICTYWPGKPTLVPHKLNIPGLAKILVVSTTGDPATPYQAGVDLAKALGGALLTVEGTRHTGFLLSGVDCADSIGTVYLDKLTVPAAATC